MATAQMIENNRVGAEIYHGAAICTQMYQKLLEEFSLPKGLIPLDNIEEFGVNRSSGFFWLKQPKKIVHKFKKINKAVVYDTEITGFIEKGCLKKLAGIKSKQVLINVTICEIFIEDPTSGKISFAIPGGISNALPISAFELEDENEGKLPKKI